jgi:hypothetical protein
MTHVGFHSGATHQNHLEDLNLEYHLEYLTSRGLTSDCFPLAIGKR